MTANEQEKQLKTEQDILQGKGCTIMLSGKSFEIGAKTPRQSRRLMAKVAQIAPMLAKLKGVEIDKATPEQRAMLINIFEPASELLEDCTDHDPGVVNALEYADEAEVMNAFTAITQMLSAPFAQRLKNRQNGPKQSDAIQR